MSNYNDEISSQHVICPYCQDTYEQEGEEFSEEERIDTCSNCGKKFHHVDSIEYNHETRPDCVINGTPHQWEPFNLKNGTPFNYCDVCGNIKRMEIPKRVKE